MKKLFVIILCLGVATIIFGATQSSLIDSSINQPLSSSDLSPLSESEEVFGWVQKYYVDDFNQPTTKGYITTSSFLEGVFSNSATTNSFLYAKLLIDKDDFAIGLIEYGGHVVKNSSSRNSESYNITIRTANDSRMKVTGTMYPDSDRIYINEKYEQTIVDALKEGNISLYIVQSDWRTTTYLFDVPASNFVEAYDSLM